MLMKDSPGKDGASEAELETWERQLAGRGEKNIIGRSQIFQAVLRMSRTIASSDASVLISGETGTGKEVISKFIHDESRRRSGPFIPVNCSAIPDNLFETELFGHSKGAFTGACDKKVGLFEEADGGTLFLDEIGDLNPLLQAKLLRVLQEKKIRRVGENRARNVNVRIISASHRDLSKEVAGGRFREDLYFRLNVIPIRMPTLRERPEDIVPLARHFLEKYADANHTRTRSLSPEAERILLGHPWVGNVRELENAMERASVLCVNDVIAAGELSLETQVPDKETLALAECDVATPEGDHFSVKLDGGLLHLSDIVQRYVAFAVQRNGGAKDKTARALGIDRKTLYKKISPTSLADL